MDPNVAGFSPAKPQAGAGTNSVASPGPTTDGRPPKMKPKPEPPKNLSAMNLKMTEKDEEVAASVNTVLSETAAKDEKHTAASKIGHAVKEGAYSSCRMRNSFHSASTMLYTLTEPYWSSTYSPTKPSPRRRLLGRQCSHLQKHQCAVQTSWFSEQPMCSAL
jgi:hypothetical protein